MRGSRWFRNVADFYKGIIPAGAGLTKCQKVYDAECGDHPRGCGAHSLRRVRKNEREGSSPRVRGSPGRECLRCRYGGIIPAGAGLTHARIPSRSLSRDHPRGCGAHDVFVSHLCFVEGSSPRVRGSLRDEPIDMMGYGIIPAGAGLTHRVRRDRGS